GDGQARVVGGVTGGAALHPGDAWLPVAAWGGRLLDAVPQAVGHGGERWGVDELACPGHRCPPPLRRGCHGDLGQTRTVPVSSADVEPLTLKPTVYRRDSWPTFAMRCASSDQAAVWSLVSFSTLSRTTPRSRLMPLPWRNVPAAYSRKSTVVGQA